MIAAAETARSSIDDPTYQALVAIVARIEITLASETQALREHRPIDLAATAFRKRQGLLELSRIMPRLKDCPATGAVRHRLAGLNAALERNRSALDVQLRAVREVSDIIAGTLRDAESDGTYSLSAWQ